MPDYGAEDEFEDIYTGKFRALVASHGLVLKYDKDRVGIDLGLHLTSGKPAPHSTPFTPTKVWFQLKGKHAKTMPAVNLETIEAVPVDDIRIDLLKFWYAQPEPVYLVVYLESVDDFLMEDVRDIVDRRWGADFLSLGTFKAGQKTVTLHVSTRAVVTNDRLNELRQHRSMRIDGPQWRGRPLGHRLDPLRSSMKRMQPDVFRALVLRMLEAHGFEEITGLDADAFLGADRPVTDLATLTVGRMHYTYEWVHPITTEFGYGPNESFRIEGDPMFVQGPCAVLIHEQIDAKPDTSGFDVLAKELEKRYGVRKLLAFVNQPHSSTGFGTYFAGARPLSCVPQDLSSLSFNVLTATSVFLEFSDQIEWEYVNYL